MSKAGLKRSRDEMYARMMATIENIIDPVLILHTHVNSNRCLNCCLVIFQHTFMLIYRAVALRKASSARAPTERGCPRDEEAPADTACTDMRFGHRSVEVVRTCESKSAWHKGLFFFLPHLFTHPHQQTIHKLRLVYFTVLMRH